MHVPGGSAWHNHTKTRLMEAMLPFVSHFHLDHTFTFFIPTTTKKESYKVKALSQRQNSSLLLIANWTDLIIYLWLAIKEQNNIGFPIDLEGAVS